MAAELAEREGRAAAEIVGHVEAAGHRQVGTAARTVQTTDAQHLSRLHIQHRVHRHRAPVDRQRHGRAGHGDAAGAAEAQRRPGHRDLQRRNALRIAQQPIRQAQRQRVHRARGRHAHRPVAEPAGPILHRGLHARTEHVDRAAGRGEVVQAAGGVAALHKCLEAHHRAQVVQVAGQPGDAGVGQALLQTRQRLLAGVTVGDQLGQHRVVMRAHLGARLDPGVDAQVVGKMHLGQQAGGRLELLVGVLGVQPGLHRVALRHGLQRAQRRQRAGAQAHHPFDDVYAGDSLGHAMLHLQARIDLQEEELLGACIHHEFHRARRPVLGAARQRTGGCLQRLSHLLAQVGRRCFLHHFLVAALQRTVALAQRQHAALPIAEDLHLNVAGIGDIAFKENAAIGEIGLCQPPHRLECVAQGISVGAHLHADAAPAGAALEHHRVADPRSLGQGAVQVSQQPTARQERQAGFQRQGTGGVLQAKQTHLRGGGTEEDQAGGLASLHEGRIFGQEAVARVDGLRTHLPGGSNQSRRDQITGGHRGRPDADRLVGHRNMARFRICFGVHRYRGHAESAQRSDDAAGNGATVGNQDFRDHGQSRLGQVVLQGEKVRRGSSHAAGSASVRQDPRRGSALA